MRRIALAALLCSVAFASRAGDFSFVVVGDRFTYTDAARTFEGRWFAPPGAGPGALVGALVLLHGQGSSPASTPNFSSFATWNVVLIAPELTHVLGGATDPENTGFTPENLARVQAVVAALGTRAEVDTARIGVFGHSKGAYAAIGSVSALGAAVRVAAMTAGGVVPNNFGTAQAAPTHEESAGVVSPFLMLHGNIDRSVPPERSLDFEQRLVAAGVPASRHVYDVTTLPPNVQHNFHQDLTINGDLLVRLYAWYAQWGLFGVEAALFADGFEPR